MLTVLKETVFSTFIYLVILIVAGVTVAFGLLFLYTSGSRELRLVWLVRGKTCVCSSLVFALLSSGFLRFMRLELSPVRIKKKA